MSDREPAAAQGSVRDRLLDRAAQVIAANGVDKVSLRSIAREEGVSHQAPGHFFTNKTGMLTALAARVVSRLGEEMRQVRAAAIADGADGKRIVVEIGARYVSFSVDHASLFALVGSADLLDQDSPDLRRALDGTFEVLTAAVAEAQAQGWRDDQPLESVATLCWSIVHGIAAIHNSRLHPIGLGETEPAQLLREVAALL